MIEEADLVDVRQAIFVFKKAAAETASRTSSSTSRRASPSR